MRKTDGPSPARARARSAPDGDPPAGGWTKRDFDACFRAAGEAVERAARRDLKIDRSAVKQEQGKIDSHSYSLARPTCPAGPASIRVESVTRIDQPSQGETAVSETMTSGSAGLTEGIPGTDDQEFWIVWTPKPIGPVNYYEPGVHRFTSKEAAISYAKECASRTPNQKFFIMWGVMSVEVREPMQIKGLRPRVSGGLGGTDLFYGLPQAPKSGRVV